MNLPHFRLALTIQTIVCGGTTTEEDAYVATGGSYDVNASGRGAQAAPADVNATTIGGGALASGTAAATDVVAAPDGAEGKGVISLASPLQEGLPPQGPRGSLRAGGSGRRMMQNHRQEQRRRSTNPTITVGTLGKDFNVKEKALSAAPRDQVCVCVCVCFSVFVRVFTLSVFWTRRHTFRYYRTIMLILWHVSAGGV